MPTFTKRSPMPADARALFDYHARPGALDRLIPPWQPTRLVERADHVRDGARVVMDVRLAPLIWKRWVAEHFGYVEGAQFCDRQLRGPFAAWTHTHRTRPAEDGTSELVDEVAYEPPLGALGRAVGGRRLARELERMFRFRHARTANDLRRQQAFAAAPRRTIAVSGAGGAVASNLIPFLTTAGHRVRRLVRDAANAAEAKPRGGEDAIRWDVATGAVDGARLGDCDALVHLAGKNIATRWTAAAQRELWASRVDATRKLCEALAALPRRPRTLVAASAVGYYGDRGDVELDESASPDERAWTGRMCRAWEAATRPARDAGVRVVNLRIGVVLSANSGALAKLLTPTRLGLAGRMGDGRQYMPWIAMDDLVYLIHAALMDDAWHGPVNAVTGSVRQAQFIHTLGHVLRRPTVARMPGIAVRTIFGQMGRELLLASANVRASGAGALGYAPTHATVEAALRFELGR